MKKLSNFILLLLLSFTLSGCPWGNNPGVPVSVDPYKPLIIDRNEFENSLTTGPPKDIATSGKIYVKDNLMFINDVNKGFKVFDYTNPESPVAIGYIQVLGATDLAIRDNVVYINQAVDLVSLIYNPTNNTINITHRNRNVFPQKPSPRGTIPFPGENQIVINWTL